jgi:hypothetical protein
MAIAQLAKQLHELVAQQLATAMTPLELLTAPRLAHTGGAFFSARARHPDARLVLDRFVADGYSPALLVTHRDPSELSAAIEGGVSVLQLPAPGVREGFLATNSVLAMAVALIRAALGEVLPPNLISGADEIAAVGSLKQRLLVIYPPSLGPVATDLETRSSELGTAAVQLADLRNVAHGRHTGLARNADTTAVLVLSDRESSSLAQAVSVPLAKSGADVASWHVDLPWPQSLVVLLGASMHRTLLLAAPAGLDPGRPRVPSFGRELYNLPIRRILASAPRTPVDRKIEALGAGLTVPDALREMYVEAFHQWASELSKVRLGGIVLDYDGTVCATSRRYSLPEKSLRRRLIEALKAGLAIGFASGRGSSLHEGLREWIPEVYWSAITVGLYNGAERFRLSDELPDFSTDGGVMAEVGERITASVFGPLVDVTTRRCQVSVRLRSGSLFHSGRLAALVRDLMAEAPAFDVKVVASGHSVDVIANDTTKVSVYETLARDGLKLLMIGDQGDSGGNDFELLAADRWSISLDRCSADPSRCWSVDPVGRRGPAALEAVLDALQLLPSGPRLDVRKIRKAPIRRA